MSCRREFGPCNPRSSLNKISLYLGDIDFLNVIRINSHDTNPFAKIDSDMKVQQLFALPDIPLLS